MHHALVYIVHTSPRTRLGVKQKKKILKKKNAMESLGGSLDAFALPVASLFKNFVLLEKKNPCPNFVSI